MTVIGAIPRAEAAAQIHARTREHLVERVLIERDRARYEAGDELRLDLRVGDAGAGRRDVRIGGPDARVVDNALHVRAGAVELGGVDVERGRTTQAAHEIADQPLVGLTEACRALPGAALI